MLAVLWCMCPWHRWCCWADMKISWYSFGKKTQKLKSKINWKFQIFLFALEPCNFCFEYDVDVHAGAGLHTQQEMIMFSHEERILSWKNYTLFLSATVSVRFEFGASVGGNGCEYPIHNRWQLVLVKFDKIQFGDSKVIHFNVEIARARKWFRNPLSNS